MRDKVQVALEWLIGLLDDKAIEYQIVGGLAARIHGGSREVADIDLYIRNSDVNKILDAVSQFITRPLGRYAEYGWDLEYFQLVYQGQKIEVGLSQNTKIQSSLDGSWYELEIDFSESVLKYYKGLELPVIPIHRLVEYKRVLGRAVDEIDIQELTMISAR